GDSGCSLLTGRDAHIIHRYGGAPGPTEVGQDARESVAVEKQKRRTAMVRPEEVDGFSEGCFPPAGLLALRLARCPSFRVTSMLCCTSRARSLVHADERLRVPVREKSGSGLKR